MAQSAFQALQADGDIPMYQANTSDEEDIDASVIPPTPLQTVNSTPVPFVMAPLSVQPIREDSKYVCSNFTSNDDNTIFSDKSVIFGLKPNENLLIRGQFILEIQRGAVDINGVIYHSSTPPMTFLNPISNALPLIQATQVTDSSKLSNKETPENQHLFTPGYKSVVKVTSLSTGLETIGRLCPQFKSLFWNSNNLTTDDIKALTEDEEAFLGYTFFPIIKPDNTISVLKSKNWSSELKRLRGLFASDELLKVVVIGGKNSGKSTFLRLLLQHLFGVSQELPIHLLDLDPGQPEYSKPDCISLSKLTEFQFGNHLSLTTPCEQINHYIGYASPKDQPRRYEELVNDLIQRYEADGVPKHESILVNTPGWIKGYGLSLTKKLIERLKPTHVVYLNSGTSDLEDLSIQEETEIIPLMGAFNSSVSKFNSAQLRVLKLLGYFHKRSSFHFDFEPLLFTPPLQISYGQSGIRAFTVLGENNIDASDFVDAVEATITAICTIKQSTLSRLAGDYQSMRVIKSSQFQNLTQEVEFKALALIHSVDTTQKLINLYSPEFEDLSKQPGQEYVLVRGSTEVPIWELASNDITKKFGKGNVPFVSFEKLTGYDKHWKVRKNVQRRGQQ